jgi:hypothetical protein
MLWSRDCEDSGRDRVGWRRLHLLALAPCLFILSSSAVAAESLADLREWMAHLMDGAGRRRVAARPGQWFVSQVRIFSYRLEWR